jgi:hypothetical protein
MIDGIKVKVSKDVGSFEKSWCEWMHVLLPLVLLRWTLLTVSLCNFESRTRKSHLWQSTIHGNPYLLDCQNLHTFLIGKTQWIPADKAVSLFIMTQRLEAAVNSVCTQNEHQQSLYGWSQLCDVYFCLFPCPVCGPRSLICHHGSCCFKMVMVMQSPDQPSCSSWLHYVSNFFCHQFQICVSQKICPMTQSE